jgi:hypothetical protein
MQDGFSYILPLESHLLRTASGFTCPTVSSKGRAAADASSYHVVLLKFDCIVVAVMPQYALWYRLKTWCSATMTEDRMCGLAMRHVHRNDTVGQVNPEAVLKRWDSSGNI